MSTLKNNSESTRSDYHKQLPVQTFLPFAINFNDIGSAIRLFNGSSSQNVEKWITNFDDGISMFNLSDLHNCVFGASSLTGKAQLLVRTECHRSTSDKLQQLVLSESGSLYTEEPKHYDHPRF